MFKLLFLLFINMSFADLRYSLDVYVYGQKNQLADSIVNPLNAVLKTPNLELNLDLRGELKWKSGNNLALIRPRITTYGKSIEVAGNTQQESKSTVDLTDAFHEYYWTGQISTTIGLQVYQWGPAEFMNASNPLYHFNTRQKSVVYKEKGQVLLRGNFSTNKENSFVLMIQPVSNNEPEWIAEDKYTPKAIFKYEKSWTQTNNYLGLVVGSEEKSNLFVGEYFNYSFFDGFSIYADVKHARDRINYIPAISGATYDMVPENQLKNQWPTLGVFGLRWEDSYDVRLEYIYNGMGYTKDDLNAAVVSAASRLNPNYVQNLTRFLRPGLEVLGQSYIYASYRINEPFNLKEFNFYSRYIQSIQDDSAQFQLEFDKALLDSYLIFSNVSFTNGALDTEFRLINDWQVLAGFKWGI
ncbi:hypothetical protein K2P97_05490 [bacterium]|nr:hypothetical protein [bacterium]